MMVRVTIDDLIEQVSDVARDGEPVLQDPVMRDQLVRLVMEEKALALGDKRAHSALTTDYPHSLQLSHKLRGTEMARRMRQFAINLQSAAGGLYVGDTDARQGGFWQRAISTVSPRPSAAAPARCRPISSLNISSVCRSREQSCQ